MVVSISLTFNMKPSLIGKERKMIKGKDIIGKPLVSYSNGVIIDKIHDVIYDASSNKVLAFLLDEGGLFSSAKIVPFESVKAIGRDALTVESAQVVMKAENYPRVKRVLDQENVAKGTKIMTEDGQSLGSIADMYFNENSGAVEGYDVTGGIFADAYTGRSFLPAPQTIKIGKDVAFVPNQVAQQMEQQIGGLKKSAMDVREQATQVTEKAKEHVGSITQRAQYKGQELTDNAREKSGQLSERAKQYVAQKSVDVLDGQTAKKTVRTADGKIMVAAGQVITMPVIQQAKAYNFESELFDAVAFDEVARSKAGAATATAGESLATGAEQIKEVATNAWESMKSKISDTKEQASQKMEEERIKMAVGRPVNRVILDSDDQVILNTGELITNQSIDQARQAGVLDILLSSVYKEKPDLSAEDLKA